MPPRHSRNDRDFEEILSTRFSDENATNVLVASTLPKETKTVVYDVKKRMQDYLGEGQHTVPLANQNQSLLMKNEQSFAEDCNKYKIALAGNYSEGLSEDPSTNSVISESLLPGILGTNNYKDYDSNLTTDDLLRQPEQWKLAMPDNWLETLPGTLNASNSFNCKLNSTAHAEFQHAASHNSNNMCETASSEKCLENFENNYSKNWELNLSIDSIFNFSEDFEISSSEKCSEFFREVSETNNSKNCEFSSPSVIKFQQTNDRCSKKKSEISTSEKCLESLPHIADFKDSKKCESVSTTLLKTILSTANQVNNKCGLKSFENCLDKHASIPEINNNDSSFTQGCSVDAHDTVTNGDQSLLSPKLNNLRNVMSTLKENNILALGRCDVQPGDDLNISFTSSDFAVSETYCQNDIEKNSIPITIVNYNTEDVTSPHRPKIDSNFCSDYFYDINCFSRKCSYTHKMASSTLSEFLSDMIVYYVLKKNPSQAWIFLKFHLRSKDDFSGVSNDEKGSDLAKCALKGLAKMHVDSELKIEELQLPKEMVTVFEMAKLEILCDQGKGNEAFEVLLNSFKFNTSSEPSANRNLFFSFIRFCEMEIHGTLLSPYEKAQQWGYTKILSVEECGLMENKLNCSWLLFHIQNNSLDMVIKCYSHLTSKIDIPKDCLAQLTLSYISFLQKNGKHSEVFEVLEKLKKLKLNDAKVFSAMCTSLKFFRVKTYAYQFFEALTELNVSVISSKMCQSLIDIAMLHEHDATLMVKATIYCAKCNYQPSSKQLIYIVQQLIKNDIDWNLLLSFVNCLSYESLFGISSILEKYFRTIPQSREADAVVRTCKCKGIDIICFAKGMSYNALPVSNQRWGNVNTLEQSNCQKNMFIEPLSQACASPVAHQNKDSNFLISHHPDGYVKLVSSEQSIVCADYNLVNKFSLQSFGSINFDHDMNQHKVYNDRPRYNVNFSNDGEEQRLALGSASSRYDGQDEIIEEIIDEYYPDEHGSKAPVDSDYSFCSRRIDNFDILKGEPRNVSDVNPINSTLSEANSSKFEIDNLYIPLVLSELKKIGTNCRNWNMQKDILIGVFSNLTGNLIVPNDKIGDIFDALLNYLFDGTKSKCNIPDIDKLMGHLGSSLLLFCVDKKPKFTRTAECVILTLIKRQLPFYTYQPLQRDLPLHTQRIAVMALQILIIGNHMDETVSLMEGMAETPCFGCKEVSLTKIRIFKDVIDKILSSEYERGQQLIYFLKVISVVLKSYIEDRKVLGYHTYETVINIHDLLSNVRNWSTPTHLRKNEVSLLYRSIQKLCRDKNIPLPLNFACDAQLRPSENDMTYNFNPRAYSRNYSANRDREKPIIGRNEPPYHQNFNRRAIPSSMRPLRGRGGAFAPY